MNFAVLCVLTIGVGTANQVVSEGLYNSDGYVTVLDDDSFARTVYGSSNAWMVEFYNSWCGHCVRFAPTWKKIAADIKDWWPVMKLGAVDCNSKKTLVLCRKFSVEAVPTVKMISPDSAPGDKGTVFDLTPMTEDSVEEGIVNIVQKHTARPGWPDLSPLSSLKNIWETVTPSVQHVLVFFEDADSYLGRKVILDMCRDTRLVLRRMVKEDISQYGVSNLPALFLIERGGIFKKLTSSSNRSEIVATVKRLLSTGDSRQPGIGPKENPGLVRNPAASDNQHVQLLPPDRVHMQDLESSVYYSFTREIAKFSSITVELLPVLKNYTAVLALYFPGTEPVRRCLKKVNDWLQTQREPITGAEWQRKFEDIQSEETYLPTTQRWTGCQGSKSHFRGYPCSLWKLFHALTVSALVDHAQEASRDPRQVLIAMRGYVTHFFGCRDCSKNFNKGAIYIERSVHSLDDSVLFLWCSHNKANFHLHGDLTEDPLSPKVQFPGRDLCPKCHNGTTDTPDSWDKAVVLAFMRKVYSPASIIRDSLPFEFKKSESRVMFPVDRVGMLRQGRPIYMAQPISITWSFTKIDLSMCFFFYVLCAVLIMFFCYHFTVTRRMSVSSVCHLMKC